MPTIRCSVCNEIYRIPTGKWKLVLPDEPYVCSADCVLQWLKETKEEMEGSRVGWNKNSHPLSFRSEFERNFSEWMTRHEIMWHYEPWAFRVGGGFYIPDFQIIPQNIFVETKGLWHMGQKKKFKKFRNAYPQIKILIVPWILSREFA